MSTADEIRDLAAGWTIPTLLRRNAIEHAEHPALTEGIGDKALTYSWSRLRSEIAAFTHGLAGLGLNRGDRMLIMMSKRPEHWVADLAAVHLGAIPCTTYETLSSDQVRFVARHSAAPVIVAEGAVQLERLLPVLDDLPALRRVIVLDEDAMPSGDDRFVGYEEVWESGGIQRADRAAEFERLTDAATPERPLCMIYTSGTTGDPKGVVLTHANAIYQAVMSDRVWPEFVEHPRTVAYLPLAHIAERMLGIYLPIWQAGHVTICADPAQLVPTLLAVRPHGFFGVPRVWEKMAAALRAGLDALPAEQRAHVDAARELALRVYRLRADGAEVPADLAARFEQVDAAVLRPIRARLGLDESLRNSSGAAPIPVAVLEFLAGIGLTVTEVWGLSETTGAATLSRPDAFGPGTVGAVGPGVEVRLADDGEILVRGPIVFAGYLQEDGTIRPDTDADGWLATGDIGTLDERGLLSITDRKKELIITSGGKNVAPSKVEGLLRAHPLIGQAVCVGDRRPYLTALLVLDEEAAPVWAAARGITGDLAALAAHPEVRRELAAAVDAANAVLSRVEQIKYFHVVDRPWSAESGELTPTLKLRRRVIAERYAGEIDKLYAEALQTSG
ncbi:MAG TPA: AMP-dependent synthetase/ligase [Actinophytocola sp.]|uniref:AMP-dependent synthetase/ligase n=1 Tax=Actinophytocola sp. TaxID=1872138 RepID=UPI002DDD605E|nr:AMP-dependent synthetase/ligase [Actinophytocola sp.]HEV2780235.1 AMP-dependent synthetase/ligase [Actinophytocola sp.]